MLLIRERNICYKKNKTKRSELCSNCLLSDLSYTTAQYIKLLHTYIDGDFGGVA